MPTAVIMPKAGMSMETGKVIKWLKRVGDVVVAGEPLVEIETDKVAMEVEAEASGFLLAVLHGSGDVVPVTQPIAYLGTEAELKGGYEIEEPQSAKQIIGGLPAPGFPSRARSVNPGTRPTSSETGGKVPMTPAARSRARELGIDPSTLRPGGKRRELRLRDVEAGFSAHESLGGLPFERIPLSRTRKVMAERLSRSMFTAPHYYLKSVIPADNLVKSRELTIEKFGRKISLNAFIMKLTAEALKKHPIVNASWQGDSIAVFDTIDIGLAVELPDGLITPIVRGCGTKGLLEIDEELARLIERAKAGKLLPDDYMNATFTISNLGSFGIEEFTAVINPPGSAILAVGALKKEPFAEADGSILAKDMIRVTLSCDHRVIDGAAGAGFLKTFRDIIVNAIQVVF